jgi:hypothetical protein
MMHQSLTTESHMALQEGTVGALPVIRTTIPSESHATRSLVVTPGSVAVSGTTEFSKTSGLNAGAKTTQLPV